MDEKAVEKSNLIWPCFVNWINTLEKMGILSTSLDQTLDNTENIRL